MRIFPLIIGIIPGFGHIWLGRVLRGLVLFFIFANGVNGYFVGKYLWERGGREFIEWGSLTVAVIAYFFAYINLVIIAKKPKPLSENNTEEKANVKEESP
jgi:hypothetical protein